MKGPEAQDHVGGYREAASLATSRSAFLRIGSRLAPSFVGTGVVGVALLVVAIQTGYAEAVLCRRTGPEIGCVRKRDWALYERQDPLPTRGELLLHCEPGGPGASWCGAQNDAFLRFVRDARESVFSYRTRERSDELAWSCFVFGLLGVVIGAGGLFRRCWIRVDPERRTVRVRDGWKEEVFDFDAFDGRANDVFPAPRRGIRFFRGGSVTVWNHARGEHAAAVAAGVVAFLAPWEGEFSRAREARRESDLAAIR